MSETDAYGNFSPDAAHDSFIIAALQYFEKLL